MDHRFSPRSPIRLSTELYHDQCHLGSFQTRDVGYRGIFVEAGRIGLLCGSLVQVGLAIPDAASPLIVDAMVVHYSAEGAGLLFVTKQAKPLAIIRSLLRPVAQKSA